MSGQVLEPSGRRAHKKDGDQPWRVSGRRILPRPPTTGSTSEPVGPLRTFCFESPRLSIPTRAISGGPIGLSCFSLPMRSRLRVPGRTGEFCDQMLQVRMQRMGLSGPERQLPIPRSRGSEGGRGCRHCHEPQGLRRWETGSRRRRSSAHRQLHTTTAFSAEAVGCATEARGRSPLYSATASGALRLSS